MRQKLTRRLAAEAIGTAFLLAAVVGSGVMGERLAAGNAAVALLANTLATGAMLVALILTFGPVSGAHLNPAVTLSFALDADTSRYEALTYILAQVAGAIAGVIVANLMFGLPAISLSSQVRRGPAQLFSEFIATLGLVLVIRIGQRFQPRMVAFAVGAYIAAGYWFTASTSFANPAVTLARSLTDTFTGIRLRDVPLFIVAQLLGAFIATGLAKWLLKEPLMTSYE